MMERRLVWDIVECLVNTKNVSDSAPQEIEYHITVRRILGAGSKVLPAHHAGEHSKAVHSVPDALRSWDNPRDGGV